MNKTIVAAAAVLLTDAVVCLAQPAGITREMIERCCLSKVRHSLSLDRTRWRPKPPSAPRAFACFAPRRRRRVSACHVSNTAVLNHHQCAVDDFFPVPQFSKAYGGNLLRDGAQCEIQQDDYEQDSALHRPSNAPNGLVDRWPGKTLQTLRR
jgi:hypothetical protein